MSEITKEEVVEVDAKLEESIAAKAAEAVKSSIQVPTAAEIAEEIVSKTESVAKKAIHDGGEEGEKGEAPKRHLSKGFESLPKEVRFAKALRAHINKDFATLSDYNQYAAKAWGEVSKSNYQNVTTAADGGALVPDPEFIAEIERLTDVYGVAARLANVRKTNNDSVTLLAGTNEVSFSSASEATAVNATKLTYSATTAALNKYIATLVITSELVEDSAVDIFQDASNEIARARAKLFDQLVFTDATYGLVTPSAGEAYKTQTVGTAVTDSDADDFMNARYKVASSARANGRYFMHPTVWNFLRQTKEATTGGYLFGGVGQSVTPTIDGIPVELVDVLPEKGAIGANKAFALYGDLGRVMLHVKRVLETKVFDAGVVKDAGGSDFNLITQDSYAMRATLRCVPQTRFAGAFCVIGTGSVS